MSQTELFVTPGSEVVSGAVISDDGQYRYRLWRTWGPGELMCFVMLNPSTADAEVNDATIRRCMAFARREGYDGIEVINLFALRATHPVALLAHHDPVGPGNWEAWDMTFADHRIGMFVAAWGANVQKAPSSIFTTADFSGFYCFGTTKDGHPCHPCRLPSSTPLVPFRRVA